MDDLLKLGFPLAIAAGTAYILKLYSKEIIGLVPKIFKRMHKIYYWEATPTMRNSKEVNHISEHLKDYNFDILKGDFAIDKEHQWVEGSDALIQQMQRFILTERNDPTDPKYVIYSDKYGIEEAETIFIEKNTVEFVRQCENIALQLIESFDEWIEVIYSITRKKDCLYIDFKVKGNPNTLQCKVPNLQKMLAKSNLKAVKKK